MMSFRIARSNVLGWLGGDILTTQFPAAMPKFVANALGARAYGFFVTTEVLCG